MNKLIIAILCLSMSGALFYCKTKQNNGGTNGKNGTNNSNGKNGHTGKNGKNGHTGHNANKNGDKNHKDPNKKNGNNNVDNPVIKKDPIPARMKKDGLLSASTYQVFITAFGSSEQEARRKGLAEGRRKAINLMRKDPVLRGKRLKPKSVKELKRLVHTTARIIRIQQEEGGAWSVVLQVEKRGLKSYLRSLP